MAFNQYGPHSNNGDKKTQITQNASKVYINPNFQRSYVDHHTRIASMYVNPQFHQHLSYQQNKITKNPQPNLNQAKIFVNPYFVRTTASENHSLKLGTCNERINTASADSYYGITEVSAKSTISNTTVTTNTFIPSILAENAHYVNSLNRTLSSTNSSHLQNVTTNTHSQGMKQSAAIEKSRYCLVRHNNKEKKHCNHNTDKTPTKMKINKYKTVSLQNAKNQDKTEKSVLKMFPQLDSRVVIEKTKLRNNQSRFKYIKNNMETEITNTERENIFKESRKRKHLQNLLNVVIKSNQNHKINGRQKFRKNNIPCPLFRKYGSCLRNSRGKCGFLHDKKHVSICRKFLKGICHDKKCLLSHEITAEKMPTCSFYLAGMCTKEDCPYLHVKLNEKALVCLDFLKGYCERGDTCLNRHLNICPDQALKGICSRRQCSYPHEKKTVDVKVNTKLSKNLTVKRNKKIDKNCVKSNKLDRVEENIRMECRYYKDVIEDNMSNTEVKMIKPTRCKLGALPSFIQL